MDAFSSITPSSASEDQQQQHQQQQPSSARSTTTASAEVLEPFGDSSVITNIVNAEETFGKKAALGATTVGFEVDTSTSHQHHR